MGRADAAKGDIFHVQQEMDGELWVQEKHDIRDGWWDYDELCVTDAWKTATAP